jgi:glycosyltransferase involved in cell wall biosynthesis
VKIAVNTRFLIKNKLEGIGWFTYETMKRIVKEHPEHEFWFFFDRNFHKEFVFADNVKPIIVPPPARHPILWYIWFEYQVTRILKHIKPDIFVSTDGFLSTRTNTPQLSVIHDINFAHNPQDIPYITRNYYNKWFPRFANKASRIATVSEYSKNDISSTYNISPNKIDVLYNGANELYVPIMDFQKKIIKTKYSQGEDYFIFVGALHPRKNVPGLLSAFELFKNKTNSSIKLIIVGEAMFLTDAIKKVYNRMKHRDDVVFTGRLEASELRYLMAAALALTFVPYFEGFGIPVLEAIYCQIPVLASNTTSIPEVGGEGALYVNPHSIDSISSGMIEIYTNEQLRDKLIEKGKLQKEKFSWQQTASKLWNSIEQTI